MRGASSTIEPMLRDSMFRRAATNLRFVRRRPDLIARAAANVLQVAMGRPRLRSLDIDLTYCCPCSCAQCYSETYLEAAADGMLQRLSAAEVGDCARQAAKLGALMVCLTGGEPLLRK